MLASAWGPSRPTQHYRPNPSVDEMNVLQTLPSLEIRRMAESKIALCSGARPKTCVAEA